MMYVKIYLIYIFLHTPWLIKEMWTAKVCVIGSNLEGTHEQAGLWWWWWWWWWWIVFVVWSTDERRLALFPAGTIVRDPHHRESPTHREQGLNLSSGLVEWSCAVVITTTHDLPVTICKGCKQFLFSYW